MTVVIPRLRRSGHPGGEISGLRRTMRIGSKSVGVPEYLLLLTLALVAGLVVWGVRAGWAIVLVPGMIYFVGAVAIYGIYRIESRRLEGATQIVSRIASLGAAVFRIVETRGVCVRGRQVGELVSVGSEGEITPELCSHAAAVLRRAAVEDEESSVERWCCPVYDHLLVFRRELVAA
jgi:hypothetical protein